MIWLVAGLIVVLVCFAGVLMFGAPYLPTLRPQVETALTLADLRSGQTLLELGCGDGKVLIAAAQKGADAVGYELNPLLAGVAWLRTRRYHRQVKIIWGDFWSADWPPSDVIFTFLLPKYMKKLDTKCIQYKYKPVKLVSFAFHIPNKEPAARQNGIFFYTYS